MWSIEIIGRKLLGAFGLPAGYIFSLTIYWWRTLGKLLSVANTNLSSVSVGPGDGICSPSYLGG